MFKSFNQKFAVTAILVMTGIAVSGCATSARSIGSDDELTRAGMTPQESLVFGKLTMQRNGDSVRIGDSLFGNSVTLHLLRDGSDKPITGAVGRGGEFAWALEPGDYTIARVSFLNRGERFEPEADFRFTVEPDSDTVYIGTIVLDSTFEYGYYGLSGTNYSYRIANHCEADCAGRLSRLGLEASEPVVALLTPQSQVVGTR